MPAKSYRISLTVIDPDIGAGVPDLRVEAWDKDLIFDDLVGTGVTDKNGHVELSFDASHFRELFHDRRPDLFFKVHRGDTLLASTEKTVLWNVAAGARDLSIELERSGSTHFWTGQHGFRVVGSDAYEDSLRIESNILKCEAPLQLRLPTLCITYADMAFANAIGGRQHPYPASAAYGRVHFDPEVEILGANEIERLTWIRGAHRVVIGSEETLIEWFPWEPLVIPRLRIGTEQPITARLDVRDLPLSRHNKFSIRVKQLANGRHVGGLRIEKAHPDWRPEPDGKEYDLWVRVIDGVTGKSLPQSQLDLYRWYDAKVTPFGRGGFAFVERSFTDGNGAINDPHREAGAREAVVLRHPGYRATVRCFRALPNQRVRFHMRAWPLKPAEVVYRWRASDRLAAIAQLAGHPEKEILKRNRLGSALELDAGREILLPCYAAAYRMDPGDTYEWLAEAFCYEDADELAHVNGFRDAKQLDGGSDTQLPGWHFFYARDGEPLEAIDEMFGLPPGWTRPVGRVHHADTRLAYPFETIAVPTQGFAALHTKRLRPSERGKPDRIRKAG